jgi:hypothetical protein
VLIDGNEDFDAGCCVCKVAQSLVTTLISFEDGESALHP